MSAKEHNVTKGAKGSGHQLKTHSHHRSGIAMPPDQLHTLHESEVKIKESSQTEEERPSPSNFEKFLPWACLKFDVRFTPVIYKATQEEYVSPKLKIRSRKATSNSPQGSSKDKTTEPSKPRSYSQQNDIVEIEATYINEDLVHIKFDRNRELPRKLFKIIELIIKFYPNLKKVTINRGLSSAILNEFSKILPLSNITEVILENCFVKEVNFHVLLEQPNSLVHLSLARCAIGDIGIEVICKMLEYPLPASKTLIILNIPSNEITDIGAGYIATFLRTNRRLKYLNLADNRLTDDGFNKILSTLKQFPLNREENVATKCRYLNYVKEKTDLMYKLYAELKETADKVIVKKGKTDKARPLSEKIDQSKTRCKNETNKEVYNSKAQLLEKADDLATMQRGGFRDPFSKDEATIIDGQLFANGNSTVCYMNVAYNHLSILTVSALVEVIKYQKRTKGGLKNVNLEGNPMPSVCKELTELDLLLTTAMDTVFSRKRSFMMRTVIKKKDKDREIKINM